MRRAGRARRTTREELDELPARQQLVQSDLEDLRDAEPGDAGVDQRRAVVDDQPAGRGHLDHLLGATELPAEGARGSRVEEVDALVLATREILGRAGFPCASEVARRGAGDDARLQQEAGDERRWLGLAEAQRDVEALGHEIAQAVAHHELQREVRVCREERAEAGASTRREKVASTLTRSRPRTFAVEEPAVVAASSMPASSGATCS